MNIFIPLTHISQKYLLDFFLFSGYFFFRKRSSVLALGELKAPSNHVLGLYLCPMHRPMAGMTMIDGRHHHRSLGTICLLDFPGLAQKLGLSNAELELILGLAK